MRGMDYRRFARSRGSASKGQGAPPVPVPTQRTKVVISCPSETGQVNWSIGHQMARALWNTAQPGCPFQFSTIFKVGIRPIQYARNLIVQEFLATDADWLIMVDDDQIMPENFWQLCLVGDADVVSGRTNCWVGNGYLPGRLRVNQYGLVKRPHIEYPECYNLFPDPNMTQPYRVAVVGTGCIAIRRWVLEALGPEPFAFTYRENGSIQAGEDVNFSVKVNNAGFVIAVLPTVKFGHLKQIDLGQVDEYAAARVTFEVSGGQHKPEDVLSIGA